MNDSLTGQKQDEQVIQEMLLNARQAFELFDRQNALLQSSFDELEERLESSHDALDRTSEELNVKVQELQRVLSRLHSILESLADGVLVINRSGVVELCNTAAQRMLGLSADQLENKLYLDCVPERRQLIRLQEVMEHGQPDLCREVVLDLPQGRMVLQSSIAPVLSEDEGLLGAVEIFRDITELRQLERQMQHQQRMAALGEMAAGVAHEMRNPLGTIEGFARLLKSDLERHELPQFSRLAERIVEGTQNLNYVITSLLDYARPLNLQCEMFSVRPVVRSLRDYLSGSALQAEVELFVEEPPEGLQMRGDQRQLRHVLINIGRNAIEACEPGGVVRISFHVYQGEVAFKVANNGAGISPEDQERLFDPFFTTKPTGTGLGLSFCHKIVEAHGGEILVQSDDSNGTLFDVIIPQWRSAL